jgi:hypothetical protein
VLSNSVQRLARLRSLRAERFLAHRFFDGRLRLPDLDVI